MKRALLFLSIILTAVTALCTLEWTSLGRSADKTSHKHSGSHHSQVALRVEGRTHPELIPDAAANEMLFRLLSSTSPEEKKELRKSTYLKSAGFGPAESVAISNAAYEYKRQIASLDAEVDEIKNTHWPRPSPQIMTQLTEMQHQKEAIIARIVGALQSQLDQYEPAKFRTHIAEEVKRNTNGFGTGLPPTKITRLETIFSDFFTVSAQSCDSLVYVYNNVSYDLDQMLVFGSGSSSMPYNNCGHTITLSTQLSGAGYSASGGEGTYLNLDRGGDVWLDGYFTSTTDADSFCPVVQQSSYAGNATGGQTIPPYVQLKEYTSVNPTHIGGGNQTTNTTVRFVASISSSCSFNVTLAVGITQGPLEQGDLDASGGGSVSCAAGSFTISYTINSNRTGAFKPAVFASNGTATVKEPSSLEASQAVTVN